MRSINDETVVYSLERTLQLMDFLWLKELLVICVQMTTGHSFYQL